MSVRDVPEESRSSVSVDGTQVSLANKNLTAVPEWLENLPALTVLDLNGNQLFQLPEWLGNLTTLHSLNLAGNPIYLTLPESIGNLSALTTLNLAGSQLTALPESIGNLSALTTLSLGGTGLCALSVLPESIANLTELTTLRVRGTGKVGLTTVPESLRALTKLTTLDLSGNQLTTVPEWFGTLTKLTTLDLSGNQLTTIPESLRGLTKLTTLDLSGNQLTTIPESLRGLTKLTTLNLSDNQVTTLQALLIPFLTKGGRLMLDGNPLNDPLPSLIKRSTAAMVTYLGSLEAEDAISLYEAKLLLVGEGNVGKTSLIAALSGAPFVDGRSTTHGIEISPLTLRHPSLDRTITLRAWDFGGQEVYRVTHQFFYSPRALYLLVWNPREGQEQDQVEGWLRRIRLRVGDDARVIIVATHCEERRPELDYSKLQQDFTGVLIDRFDVDSRTGAGIRELHNAICQHASQLPQMGQRVSPRWASARDEVLARAEDEPQIYFEQFAEICERHGLDDEETVTLAQLMHDLGHIIYYSEDQGLKDVVVLKPEWLTKAISYVLEDKQTRDAGGLLDHARLKEIWQGRDKQLTYPERHHPYFLRLMEKFDVSYRLEDGKPWSLVAQLVTYERPIDLPWDFNSLPTRGIRALSMVCRLSEPAPGLIPWLTVRHHRATTKRHWRRGVFLKHPITAYESYALLELRQSNELALEVHAPSPDFYFHALRDSIEELITDRWPGIDYDLLVPCREFKADGSMCLGQFPLLGLRMLREKGHHVYPCIYCGTSYEISSLLTGFAASDQSLAVELAQIYDGLQRMNANIEAGFAETKGQAAKTAEFVRRILRIVTTEIADCPRLVTLVPVRATGAKRVRFYANRYRLTLWCEHPGYWHPWTQASYKLEVPKEWFAQAAPYLNLVLQTLRSVIPVTQLIAEGFLPQDHFALAQKDLNLMEGVIKGIPNVPKMDPAAELQSDGATGHPIFAENEGLRALRAILLEHDRLQKFGGLRRVQDFSGDFLWVCNDHYSKYDPGLPVIPGDSERELGI